MPADVTCPACGRELDALRAGHVAILEDGFRYFCDEACKRSFVARGPQPLPSQVETAEPPRVAYGPRAPPDAPPDAPPLAPPAEPDTSPMYAERTAAITETTREGGEGPPRASPDPAPARASRPGLPSAGLPDPLIGYLPHAVVLVGATAGVLAPSVVLWSPAAAPARFVLATVALVACGMRALVVARDRSDVHPVAAVLSVAAVWGVALYARATHDARASELAGVAGLAAAFHLIAALLVDNAREGVRSARAWIRQRLDQPVRVARGEGSLLVAADEVRPGEEILVEAGDTLGVDARVLSGAATVTPWIEARFEVQKKEGDPLVAGARVVSGSLRAVTTWSGPDRAWLRLAESPNLRPDVMGPLARRVRLGIERGVLVVAAFVAAIGVANRASGVMVLAMAAVAAFSVAGTWAAGVVALQQARGPIAALAYGVVYRDAQAFDAAGRADVAVLCSRTTLLMGAPEIVALEALGPLDMRRLLALAAGASTASPRPAQAAVVEAARSRGEGPDTVRHATYHPGLGVTALTASGERLVVGSRALLLREKVSVAMADGRVSELESEGRSVTLIALGGKLVGLIALQDGLRPGARAAVQRLLDARIEPVLLSGEARDTCETIGRALDIEHIRPEVLPEDRGKDVRALADGGHVVAVLGTPDGDAHALGAADVSVALGAAGSTPGEWSVSLAGGGVKDAARALAIATECRHRTKVATALGLAPAGLAALGVALGIVPLAVAPLLSLSGVAAAVVHARR